MKKNYLMATHMVQMEMLVIKNQMLLLAHKNW